MRANQSTIGHENLGPEPHLEAHPEAHSEEMSPAAHEARALSSRPGPRPAFYQRAGVRQLVKFCLVGLSSTVIDQGTKFVLLSLGEKYAPNVPWWLWLSFSFGLAVTNGYFWNRKWTFQATSEAHGSAQSQYHRFIITNVVGLGLNLVFTKVFLIAFTGQLSHDQNPDKKHVILASLCAVPIVVIWNFCAAKFWTFKPVK